LQTFEYHPVLAHSTKNLPAAVELQYLMYQSQDGEADFTPSEDCYRETGLQLIEQAEAIHLLKRKGYIVRDGDGWYISLVPHFKIVNGRMQKR
jgi:hypothetical protein